MDGELAEQQSSGGFDQCNRDLAENLQQVISHKGFDIGPDLVQLIT